MNDFIDLGTLERYVAGQTTAVERAQVDQWVAGDPERARYLDSLHAIGETWAAALPAYDSADAWHRVRTRVQSSVAASPVMPVRRPSATDLRTPWRFLGMIAAVLAVMIGGRLVVRQIMALPGQELRLGGGRVYATSAGQRATVRLLDGTQVTLAPESRLTVADSYGKGGRTIALEGEAFFVVVHDTQHPFAVQTTRAMVRDVGTEFVVRAYPDDPDEQVAVTAGAIDVTIANRVMGRYDGGRAPAVAGDLVRIASTGLSVAHDANTAALTAWLQGRLVFNNVPLRDVIRELGRTFDITVALADTSLANELVTGNFGGQGVDEILWEVTAVIGARYERNGRHVVIRHGASDVRAPQRTAPPAPPPVLVQDSHR